MSVELVLLAPLIIASLLMVIQFSVRAHAEHVAQAAAAEGAAATATWDGSESTGMVTAHEFLDTSGASLTGESVTASRGLAESTVTVRANVLTLLPGLHLHVEATSSAPTERFVP